MSTFYYQDPNAPRPTRPRRVSVAALIEDGGRLLLERRSDAPVWGLIAGLVEDDETLGGALRREVKEETGLSVTDYLLFGTFSDPLRVVHYADGAIFQPVTLVYSVTIEDLKPLRASHESLELRFFAARELPPSNLAPTHVPIVERYLSDESPPFLD